MKRKKVKIILFTVVPVLVLLIAAVCIFIFRSDKEEHIPNNDDQIQEEPTNIEYPRYAEEWYKVLERRKPLEIGESYTETFSSDDYLASRLYPEYWEKGTTISWVDEDTGVGDGKNLKITSSGTSEKRYTEVVFRGMQMVPGARYRVSVTVKTRSKNTEYYVGFHGQQNNYVFRFSGNDGAVQRLDGTISLKNCDYDGLVIAIVGEETAELLMDDLTIERLEPLPMIDLTEIGASHTFDFNQNMDYAIASNSVIQLVANGGSNKALQISKMAAWQGVDISNVLLKAKGTYQVSFKIKRISGTVGQAYATMSSAANGSYQDVGKAISISDAWTTVSEIYTLKEYDDYYFNLSLSSEDCVFAIDDLVIECVDLKELEKWNVDLTKVGSKFSLDFDGISERQLQYYCKAVNSNVKRVDNGNGKALQITKVGEWQGLNFANIKLAAEGIYKVSMNIKLISGTTDQMYVTMSSAVNGTYEDIGVAVTPTTEGLEFRSYYALKNFEDYYLSISAQNSSCVFEIDDVVIEHVTSEQYKNLKVDLTEVGARFGMDFDTASMEDVLDHCVGVNSDLKLAANGSRKALRITKVGEWQGLNFTNIKLAAEGIYKVSMNIKLISGTPDQMYVTMSSAANGTFEDIGVAVTPTAEGMEFRSYYALKNFEDYYLSISAQNSSCVFEIDDVVIERVASDQYENLKVDLTEIGSKFEMDFDTVSMEDVLDHCVGVNSDMELVANGSGKTLRITKTGEWQGLNFTNIKLAAEGIYKVSMHIKLISGTPGQMYVTMSSAANGTFEDIGMAVTPTAEGMEFTNNYTLKNFEDYYLSISAQNSSCVFEIDDVVIERLDPDKIETIVPIDLTTLGAKYEENFDTAEAEKYFVSTGHAAVEVKNGVLSVVKKAQWQGVKGQNFRFAKGNTYRFTFDLYMIQMSTIDYFEVVFADGTPNKVSHSLANYVKTGEKVNVTFEMTLKEDATEFLIGCWDGGAVYTIDNLCIENVKPGPHAYEPIDLTTPGAKYEENFDTAGAENYFVTTGHGTVEVKDGVLSVRKTSQWQGLKSQNIKFAKDNTYKFSFDLEVKSMSSTDFFELIFADGTANKVSHGLAGYVKLGEKVNVTFEVTLKEDATEFLIGCWDGGARYNIDNLQIENTTP